MFLETSALVEVMLDGPRASLVAERLSAAERVYISPLVRYEVVSVLSSRLGSPVEYASEQLVDFLSVFALEDITITPEIGEVAISAMARYGKGRGHPAQLNFGDCFSYACAKAAGVPLLYVGSDFSHTDIA